MAVNKRDRKRLKRRCLRVRNRIAHNDSIPRVAIFRSLKHIYAQIIDDSQGKTLVSDSTLSIESVGGDKKAQAHAVGVALAKHAHDNGISSVRIDRGACKYHGRVASLVDGLREGGIKV